MEFRNLRIYQPDGSFRTGGLTLSGDRIGSAQPSADACDMGGLYAIPGLVDIHFHGCAGYDLCDGTHEALSAMTHYQAAHGICAICPATMTLPEERLAAIMEAAASYRTGRWEAALAGVNLEGPFLAESRKGAQNGAYLQDPDAALFRRLQEKAQGLIRQERVKVDGQIRTDTAGLVEPGCLLSVRGYGKYVIEAFDGVSKKGRLHITAGHYE